MTDGSAIADASPAAKAPAMDDKGGPMPFEDFDTLELQLARETLETAEADTEEYAAAFATLRTAVEAGGFEYVWAVAEAAALDGPCRDAALAYMLYHVAHAIDGGSVAWDNRSPDAGRYLGPDGDFRNEASVSDLVDEPGLEALPPLDAQAGRLLARHP